MNDPANALQLIREHFAQISRLACWDVHQGYGSFVTFEFGKPSFFVRFARPESKFVSMRRNTFEVRGDYHLWIEQCDWRIVDLETILATSTSSEDTISAALKRITRQTLQGVRIVPEFGVCAFSFEHGTNFEMQRYADFQSDDPMWHLYCPNSVISYLASGQIEYGTGDEVTPRSIHCDNVQLRF